jgi:hypothetical protein
MGLHAEAASGPYKAAASPAPLFFSPKPYQLRAPEPPPSPEP